jgi:hypothetical protein
MNRKVTGYLETTCSFANWHCLLQQVTEGKIKGEIEVTGRRGRIRRKLLDDLKERRGYSHLKEEALDSTMWRAGLGRGFGPVVRQTAKWTNEWMNERWLYIQWVLGSKRLICNVLWQIAKGFMTADHSVQMSGDPRIFYRIWTGDGGLLREFAQMAYKFWRNFFFACPWEFLRAK